MNHLIGKCKRKPKNTVKQGASSSPSMANRNKKQDPELNEMAQRVISILRRNPATDHQLQIALNCDMRTLSKVLDKVKQTHELDRRGINLSLESPPFGRLEVDRTIDPDGWVKIGLVSDTHLGCREERLDALHAQYDIFEREGITQVFHAGNLVDGFIQRINGASATHTTPDGQIQHTIDCYPVRKGMITYFITGDDHEGWWIKEGYNWGRDMMQTAMSQGRHDLVYIGHVEADVEFRGKAGSTIMKVQHPGGGSAYARSYTGQKQVEAFQGGEKPHILVQGHYHVSNHMVERNVHVISMPGFEDQTVFARKKRLRMEVGGAILEFKQSLIDGTVSRCRLEFNMFYDRGYYRPFLQSDTKLVKGHLVIPGK